VGFGLALLNIFALGFGVLEYYRGIEPFFPVSPVTSIMYASGDVVGGHYRIPSIFTSAHAYAGTLVSTIPFLYGAWIQPEGYRWKKLALLFGLAAAFMGVLLASTRTFFVMACFMAIVVFLSGGMGAAKRVLFIAAVLLIALLALSNERFQRFKALSDYDMVAERIAGSVNRSFFEILVKYPMGNGLGGGGTSLPYFLQSQVQRPIGGESEFSRILAEQGIIGLGIWIGFLCWCIFRRAAFVKHSWLPVRRLIWCWWCVSFVISAIGLGLLTAIPNTFLMLLALGWTVVIPPEEQPVFKPVSSRRHVLASTQRVYAR
jgi:hypothetical protein